MRQEGCRTGKCLEGELIKELSMQYLRHHGWDDAAGSPSRISFILTGALAHMDDAQ